MCDEHDHAHVHAGPARPSGGAVSRRAVLRGAGVAATAALLPWAGSAARPALAGAAPADRLVRMALHVHASFSEGLGSMGSQLQCARDNAVDVVWFTEHDWRMAQHSYRTHVSFDGLVREDEFGRSWIWQPSVTGKPAAYSGGIVTSPVSPRDPSTTPGALRVAATASATGVGDGYLYYAQSGKSRQNDNGNVTGTQLALEVFAQQTGPDAWGVLRVLLSNHPASGGRPAGQYVIEYRFGAGGARSAQGFTGVVPVAVTAGAWTSVQLDPTADIRALWPDLVAEDNTIGGLWLGVAARARAQAAVVFDYLRFVRSQPVTLSPFQVQRGILAAYAKLYGDITALAAQEVSFLPEHLGWLGGDDHLLTYPDGVLSAAPDPSDTNSRARSLAARGGAVAINHPFGAEGDNAVDSRYTVASLAAQYLTYGAYGATMLEVGYANRGGASLDDHLALWDALSRNGVYLTGTGVNDDHEGLEPGVGNPWRSATNRFTTSVWSPTTGQADLLAQLASGRTFTSELTARDATIGLGADGVPMGAVSVRPELSTRTLTVSAAALPKGSTVELVQGAVDYAGTKDPNPTSRVVDGLTAKDLRRGTAAISVDTRASSFVRAVVRDATGRGIALSNPVWLLREASHTAVPVARRAADTSW